MVFTLKEDAKEKLKGEREICLRVSTRNGNRCPYLYNNRFTCSQCIEAERKRREKGRNN